MYNLFIRPIENLLFALLNFFHGLIGDYGLSILMLSISVTLLLTPFMRLLKRLSNKPKEKLKQMQPYIEKINAMELPKDRRMHMIDTLHKQFKYTPLYAFFDIFPLFVQLPFLIAVYYMIINNSAILTGESFLFIKNLAEPDHFIGGINLLPILMTAINICAAYIMPEGGRKEFIQACFLAGVFLILLYTVAAAAVLYWTFNNIITLIKYMITKNKTTKGEAL